MISVDCTPIQITDQVLRADRLWLFLDYDGTLASFAPSPEVVAPDLQVIDLAARGGDGPAGLLLAQRYHPDNAETGDVEKFLQLRRAYMVLADPTTRIAYDSHYEAQKAKPMPIFGLKEFVDVREGEANRRLQMRKMRKPWHV